jgi:hypothetical protein
MEIFVQPQFAKTFGEPFYTPSAPGGTNANTLTLSSGVTVDTSVLFHQGYFAYLPFRQLRLIVGRQALSYGDELVIGQLDWGNIGRSFDAVRASLNLEVIKADLFTAKIVDNNSRVNFASQVGDRDLSGFYSTTSKMPGIQTLDLYLFYLNDAQLRPNYRLALLGTRILTELNPFDFRIETGQEFFSAKSGQVDAELGLKLKKGIQPRIALGLFQVGKDYNQLYPGWHRWFGYADLFGRRNIKGYAIHSSIKPYDGASLAISYQAFWRQSLEAPAYQLDGTAAWGSTSKSQARGIASEIDVTFKTDLQKNVDLTLGVSRVFLREYLTIQFGNLSPWFYYLQMGARF